MKIKNDSILTIEIILKWNFLKSYVFFSGFTSSSFVSESGNKN